MKRTEQTSKGGQLVSKKIVALITAGALAVPAIAQATHESGKAGAPGQVCKSIRTAKKDAVQQARADGKRGKDIAALVKTFNAGYKACVTGAAKARSNH
jgi:hypothetical protein